MDYPKHGESAYPADAWVETQYMKEGANVSRTEIISYIRSVQGKIANGCVKPAAWLMR